MLCNAATSLSLSLFLCETLCLSLSLSVFMALKSSRSQANKGNLGSKSCFMYLCLHNESRDEKWARHRTEQIMATKQLECAQERVPGKDYDINLYLTPLHSVWVQRLWCGLVTSVLSLDLLFKSLLFSFFFNIVLIAFIV